MELPPSIVHALRQRAAELGDRAALWSKREGRWTPISWRDYAGRSLLAGRGLVALGLQAQGAVGILSFNRPEWHLVAYGAMAAGGMPVGIYTTCSPEQVQYILGHCEARVAVVENLVQLAKVQAVREQLPKLAWAVVLEGDLAGQPDWVLSFEQLLAKGQAVPEAQVLARADALQPQDLATLIYTSGTTGPPKGVMLSHHNLVWTAAHLSRAIGAPNGDVMMSYLPLSHIAEQLLSMHCGVWNHLEIYFAESLEKLPENLREVRPTLFFGVPRVWEKFKARLEEGIASAPPRRQAILARARKVAEARNALVMEGHKVPPLLAGQYALAQRVVFSKLRARLGLERCKVFGTSAAPIGRDVLEFFRSIDIVLQEAWGQSEVTGPATLNTEGAIRFGTLGRPLPGVTVKIAEDGEILVQGGNVCLGYYKDPAGTAGLLQQGWLHTGDVGEFDPQGYLRITDRKKDLIVTSGGKKAAPQNLESMLRAIAPVGQAVVVGERRNYLCALLTLDRDAALRFARTRGLPEDPGALSRSGALQAELQRGIDAMNARLAQFETIKKFVVLEGEFSEQGGELTPTLKIKRKAIEEKYRAQIEGMYG